MRCKLEVLSLAVLLATAAISTTASAAPIALGLRSGTLGLYGAEATLGLSDRINLRVPFSAFDYSYNDDSDGVDYKGKLKLKSFGGQIDLHPFKGSFYLTAGVFANDNRLKLHARDTTGTEVYELGNNDVSFRSDPNDPLTLDGHVKFGSTAPFLGLGWGNAIQGASNFYFRFELGALFQGSTEVGLAATGSAIPEGSNQSFDTEGNTPQGAAFRQTLAQERDKLDADVSDALKIYPSVNIALGFRFGQ